MLTFIDRLANWKDTTLKKLKQRSWRAWLAVVASGYIVLEVIRAFISDAGTLLLVWVYQGVQWLVRQPMGFGGLAFFLFLMLLTGRSWLETRPRPLVKAKHPKPLSEQERRLVQDLRTVWNRHGERATTQLNDILQNGLYELERREFWAELLKPVVDALAARRNEFESILDPAKHAQIDAVRGSFNELYAAYIKVMKWVAILQARDLLQLPHRSDQRFQVWRQNHRDMVNRLHDLNEDPEHRGTLKIFLNWIDDPAFRVFVREAEMSPEWLALVRESEIRGAAKVDERSSGDA